MRIDVHLWAAIGILVMTLVIAFFDWVPTALNRNIEGMSVRERLPSTIVHSTLGVGFAIVNALAWKWVIALGAVWYSVVLFAAVRNWWVPYFAGTYPGEITTERYAEHYSRNLTVLPRFRGHPVVPDVQHTTIHSTVLAACVLSWGSFWAA